MRNAPSTLWLIVVVVMMVFPAVVRSSRSSWSSRRLKKQKDDGDIFIFLDMDGVLAPWPLEGKTRSSDSTLIGGNDDDDDDDDDDQVAAEEAEEWVDPHDPYVKICFNVVPDHTLAVLSDLLKELPPERTKIVFSSAWRNRVECEMLALDYIHQYGKKHKDSPLHSIKKFYDRTGPPRKSRQKEIMEWLLEMEDTINIAAWVVLDDLQSVLEDQKYHEVFKHHAVITEKNAGLAPKDVEKALKLLNQQLGQKAK